MAARSEAEVTSLLVYKSPAWKGGVLYYVDDRYHLLALARRKDDIAALKAHSSWVHTTV